MTCEYPAPGCCQTWGCTLGYDQFNRADSTNLSANWLERGNANWQIKDNCLYSPGGRGTALAAFAPDHPRRGVHVTGIASASHLVGGAVYRIVFDYVDEDNYVYVDFRVNGSNSLARIYIGVRSGGSDTDRFWNDMDVDITTQVEAGYEPEGNGLIWVEVADSSGAGGARLLEAQFDPDDIIPGKCWGVANVGDAKVAWDEFWLGATVDSDEEVCTHHCGCHVMRDGGHTYLYGIPRQVLTTFWNASGCPGIDEHTEILTQIQNENHPDFPDPIPGTGLSYKREWRAGAGSTCPDGYPTNWTFLCESKAGFHNNAPETIPSYYFASNPGCLRNSLDTGPCMNAVGPYDVSSFDQWDAHPDDSSTCDPLYLRFKMATIIESGDDDCPSGYLYCCGCIENGAGVFYAVVTEIPTS